MQPHPSVSVIMGVYNRQRFLRPAILSVLTQTLTDFEFIIVNDGSTDASAEILREFAQTDPRIVVISSAVNQGVAKSLNLALGQARAECLAIMDSDDVAMRDRLQTEFSFLTAHPEIVLVGSHAKLIDFNGANIPVTVDLPTSHEEIDQALLGLGWPVIHPTVMLRTACVRMIGGYDEAYPSKTDHDLLLRMAEKGRLANLKDVLLAYRIHHEALTARSTRVGSRYVQDAIREACNRRAIVYPPEVKPGNRGLNFSDVYWRTGIRGLRQLARVLIRSPNAFWGQLRLTISRSGKLRRLFRVS